MTVWTEMGKLFENMWGKVLIVVIGLALAIGIMYVWSRIGDS